MRRGQMAAVVLVVLGMVTAMAAPGLAQEGAPVAEAHLLRRS